MVDLHPGMLARFIRATAVLGMPAEQQEHWLGAFHGGHVDELALDWDSGWRLLDQWVALGWLSETDAAAFGPIDAALAAISGRDHSELWTAEALHHAVAWSQIRELATAALFDL